MIATLYSLTGPTTVYTSHDQKSQLSPTSYSYNTTSPSTPLHPAAISVFAFLLLLLLSLLGLLAVCVLYRKYHNHKQLPSPNPSSDTLLPQVSPLPSPISFSFTPDGYLLSLDDQQKVWVLYSLDTPEDQQATINELMFAGLQQCGLLAQTPGTIPCRDILREWMEKGVTEASAVFFVCNDQFYREWLSDATDSGGGVGGGVTIGRDARMLKNGVSNNDLTKFAFVHFETSDVEFRTRYPEIQTPFISRYFSLSGDKLATVQSIASFVKNIPKYELSGSLQPLSPRRLAS